MSPFQRVRLPLLVTVAGTLSIASAASAWAAQSCSARSGASAPTVVELYTSEGCNSCPPADKWLSRVKTDPAVVALAFHVDYWDRLGWKDRFANPAYTQRQGQQQAVSGARFSYTPQVIVDGVDRPDWPRASLPASHAGGVPVEVQLVREGNRVTAVVTPTANSPARLAAYWAVTEQDHVSAVKAGENEGVTLHHDQVVREYKQVTAWSGGATTLQFDLTGTSDAAHPRQVNLVVVNADSGRPVQAVRLGC